MAYKVAKRKPSLKKKLVARDVYIHIYDPKARKELTTLKVAKQFGRIAFKYPQLMYKEGALLSHKGKTARLEKVKKKGVYITTFKKPDGLFEPEKTKFLTHEQYIKTTQPEWLLLGV